VKALSLVWLLPSAVLPPGMVKPGCLLGFSASRAAGGGCWPSLH